MSSIVVVAERWLGVKKNVLTVRVDGREIGSLGRVTKRVSADVDPGRHTVEVISFGGWTTKAITDTGNGDTVFDVAFPGFSHFAACAMAGLRPDSSDASARGMMRLVNRSEQGFESVPADVARSPFEPWPSALVAAVFFAPVPLILGGFAIQHWVSRPAGLALFWLGLALAGYTTYLRRFRYRRR